MPVTLLLVDAEPARPAFPRDRYETFSATGQAQALDLLGKKHFDVVVSKLRLPDGSGLDLCRACAERYPETRRILLAAYEDLPELVAARAHGVVSRVVPLTAPPERVARAVQEALSPADDLSVSRTGVGFHELQQLLGFSAARLAQTKGAIIRPLPPDGRALQLQFVLQQGKRVEKLRADLVKEWLWPVKPRDGKVARKDRKHPVVRMLGGLSEESEVYARHIPGERAHAYLVLLPWKREARITAALGIVAEKFRPELWELLEAAHAEAVAELAEFAMPALEEASGVGQAIPEYDWIVTPTYVGPERRRRPTSFLNRFIFMGRRKRVPSRLARATDQFTDVPHPRVWAYFAAYPVLACVDTALTWRCVRSGLVQEANPLLRPLVLDHPWWFLIVKNSLAVLAFLTVARFQLFRYGMWALRAAVLLYLLLDVYWALLLARL